MNWIKIIILNITKKNKLKAWSGRLYLVNCGKTRVYRNTIHMIFVRSSTNKARLRRAFSFSFNSSTFPRLADSGFSLFSARSNQNSYSCLLSSFSSAAVERSLVSPRSSTLLLVLFVRISTKVKQQQSLASN